MGNLWLNRVCCFDIKRKYFVKIFMEDVMWYLGF